MSVIEVAIGLSDRTLEWLTPVLYLRGQDSGPAGPAHAPRSVRAEDLD